MQPTSTSRRPGVLGRPAPALPRAPGGTAVLPHVHFTQTQGRTLHTSVLPVAGHHPPESDHQARGYLSPTVNAVVPLIHRDAARVSATVKSAGLLRLLPPECPAAWPRLARVHLSFCVCAQCLLYMSTLSLQGHLNTSVDTKTPDLLTESGSLAGSTQWTHAGQRDFWPQVGWGGAGRSQSSSGTQNTVRLQT